MASIDEEISAKDEVEQKEELEMVDAHLQEDDKVSFKTWLVVMVSTLSSPSDHPTQGLHSNVFDSLCLSKRALLVVIENGGFILKVLEFLADDCLFV
jgi:hypothetical protein